MQIKKYWSRPGIILGTILIMFNILLSFSAYHNPAITHPHDFSGFALLTYPNVLLGLPIILLTPGIIDIIFYTSQQNSLFIQLFVLLSIYWFFIGVSITWIYNKIPRIFKIFFIVIVMLFILIFSYFYIITFFPSRQASVLPSIDNQ